MGSTSCSFRTIYQELSGWSFSRRAEVLEVAVRSRNERDDLLRGFRGGQYCFDMLIDVGAYRDMHRHRRCHQYRQAYTGNHGYDVPVARIEAGADEEYRQAMDATFRAMNNLSDPASQYLLPFGARSRFLFKMGFVEAEYISRTRSGVKGHFQLPRNCLGDQVPNRGNRTGPGPLHQRHSSVDRRSSLVLVL
jgi:hypothetical protein